MRLIAALVLALALPIAAFAADDGQSTGGGLGPSAGGAQSMGQNGFNAFGACGGPCNGAQLAVVAAAVAAFSFGVAVITGKYLSNLAVAAGAAGAGAGNQGGRSAGDSQR